jgi:acetate kinase
VSRILVVNAGSTSMKLSLVDEDGRSEKVGALHEAEGMAAVTHRIVHGGARFRDPVVVDAGVRAELDGLTDLAPLHNAPALRALDEATALLPSLPQIAVFDTAFHATLPDEAATYALPRSWRNDWGICRYGFHGLSVAWSAERVPFPRLVVCHLGGGCSVTAVRDGRSVETTMGFSPLEGVPMATRSGSISCESGASTSRQSSTRSRTTPASPVSPGRADRSRCSSARGQPTPNSRSASSSIGSQARSPP